VEKLVTLVARQNDGLLHDTSKEDFLAASDPVGVDHADPW